MRDVYFDLHFIIFSGIGVRAYVAIGRHKRHNGRMVMALVQVG
jgi:hypothetical protein